MKKLLGVLAAVALCAPGAFAQNVSGQVVVSQFAQWRLNGVQPLASGANTLVPFGGCQFAAGGKNFFALSSAPVRIVDPGNPVIDETVTPSTVVVGNTCTATLSPAHAHPLPYYLVSATGGLQEAIQANVLTGAQNTAILDSRFYAAGGSAAVIYTAAGNGNLGLLDVTQAPNVAYRWNGTHYVANGNVGGAAPTAAAGAAAGSTPSITNTGNGNTFTVSLTTGTSTTTGTLFTETWPSSASFSYVPNVTVTSTGGNAPPAFTYTVTGTTTHVLTVTLAVAPPESTAYTFQVSAQ